MVMRLRPVGMSQRTAGTQHDQRGIHQHCAADNRKVMKNLTQSLHVAGPYELFYVDYTALPILGAVVHEYSESVYLRMLMHANGCYNFDIVLLATETSHLVPQQNTGSIDLHPLPENGLDVH